MDKGDTERAIADGIKDIVKHTSRRKASVQPLDKSKPLIMIAPKSSDNSVENRSASDSLSRQHNITLPSTTQSILSISADESTLLMHFLDNVFPLQYSMYKPVMLEGGRGWLLTVLLRTRALYHAALALSAHYCRTSLSASMSRSFQTTALLQQEQHLRTCLQLLNQSAQYGCPHKDLGMVFAMVQLMFFEVFTLLDVSQVSY